MKIVFFSTPAWGHINSVLAVLREVSRRHQLIAYSAPAFRQSFEAFCEFREYDFDFSRFPLETVTADFLALYRTLLEVNRDLYEPAVALLKAERPDLVLHDSLTGFAKQACQSLKLPAACFTTTLAYNPTVFLFSNLVLSSLQLALSRPKALAALRKEEHAHRRRHHLPGESTLDLFANHESLNLVFAPRFFQPWHSSFGRDYGFVGSTVAQRCATASGPVPRATTRPWAYVSLGTIFSGNTEVLEGLVKLAVQSGYHVVVSTKHPLALAAGDWEAAPHWNQLAVLERSAVFINHGGINGVLEALWFKVPQVWLPQQDEQRLTALRAQRLGLGVVVKEGDSASVLRALVRIAAGDFEAAIARARSQVDDQATERAVGAIEQALKKQRDPTDRHSRRKVP